MVVFGHEEPEEVDRKENIEQLPVGETNRKKLVSICKTRLVARVEAFELLVSYSIKAELQMQSLREIQYLCLAIQNIIIALTHVCDKIIPVESGGLFEALGLFVFNYFFYFFLCVNHIIIGSCLANLAASLGVKNLDCIQ